MVDGLTHETLMRIRAESVRAVAKHGVERTPLGPVPAGDKLAILGEEYGEVCRALTYDEGAGLEHLRDELIQVASVAACWAQALSDELEANRVVSEGNNAVISET